VYASRLLNIVEQNYSIIEREALAMVFALHKFRHYLLSSKFVFYANHMALVYLVNKPQVSGRIVRWLLLFLEYDFIIVYKPNVIADACQDYQILQHNVSNQTTNPSLFYIKLEWFNDVKEFLKTGWIEGTLSV
jgi:hypothetical protein